MKDQQQGAVGPREEGSSFYGPKKKKIKILIRVHEAPIFTV